MVSGSTIFSTMISSSIFSSEKSGASESTGSSIVLSVSVSTIVAKYPSAAGLWEILS